jgi:hypothetical protein
MNKKCGKVGVKSYSCIEDYSIAKIKTPQQL